MDEYEMGWSNGYDAGYDEGFHDGISTPRGSAVDEKEWLERVNSVLYRYDRGLLDVRGAAAELEAYR